MKIRKILAFGITLCFFFVFTACEKTKTEEVPEVEIPESMQNINGPSGPPYSVGPSGPPPSD